MIEMMPGAGAHKEPEFMTSISEVAKYVSTHLNSVAAEFKPLECDSIVTSKAGVGRVLSGVVSFKESASYTDSYQQFKRGSFLLLGHAALGPDTAVRTVSSVRRELMKQLRVLLPYNSISEGAVGCSFKVKLPDGELSLRTLVDAGRSLVEVTMTARIKSAFL